MEGIQIQRQREDRKKDNGWTEESGDWESEDVSEVKKRKHT
jgi:hypothetical protein